MDTKDLISVYDNRWNQIHHLNELDLRSLVLAVTAITGVVVSAKASPTFPVLFMSAVACMGAVVCAGAIYSTIHNRISMEQALAAIDFVEVELNKKSPGLFQFAGKYQAPRTIGQFVKGVGLSIRGPILAFFAVALMASVAAFAHCVFAVCWMPLYERVLSATAGIAVSVLVTWFSFRFTWRAVQNLVSEPSSPRDGANDKDA